MNLFKLVFFILFLSSTSASYLPESWFDYSGEGFKVQESDLGEFDTYYVTYQDHSTKGFYNLTKALSENKESISNVFAVFVKSISSHRYREKIKEEEICTYKVRMDSPNEHNYYLAMPYCREKR